MTGQTNDSLADKIAATLDSYGVHEFDGSYGVPGFDNLVRDLAAVIRASGAGLGGTTREQVAQTVYRAIHGCQYERPAGPPQRGTLQAYNESHWLDALNAADAVLALRPDPAPDDTADLPGQTLHSQAEVALDLAEQILAERDAARADLAALRAGIEAEAKRWIEASSRLPDEDPTRATVLACAADLHTRLRALLGDKDEEET